MKQVYIIAEAGVNHNGSLETAKKMIYAARNAHVDAIKFQTFRAENLVTKKAKKADYQQKAAQAPEFQFEMLKGLELSKKDFQELKGLCQELKLDFLSTPFDLDSIDLLMEIGVDKLKLPSGEITDYPYLVKMAGTKKPVIVSSGMCTMEEIAACVQVLQNNGTKELSLLHCTTEYPAPYEDVNLKAMESMRERFGVSVGYSDHTEGIEIPVAAAALGAEVIEKHFTLDRNMKGPDHKASLEPGELAQMVKAIRNVERAMGDGMKVPSCSEMKNIMVVRKSIVAKCFIREGEMLTEKNLTTKRPGNGISPMEWNHVIGTRAVKNFVEDELIQI